MKKKVKIAIITNTDWSLYNFRRNIIEALHKENIEVCSICSETGFWRDLSKLPITNLQKSKYYFKNINPIKDIQFLFEYYIFYKKEKPIIVHNFTLKPVIYSTIAAKLAGVPYVVSTITGLGYVFSSKDIKRRIIGLIATSLYKIVSYFSDYWWFQNKDDLNFFTNKKFIKYEKCGLIPGSGVNVKYFSKRNVSSESIRDLREEIKLADKDVAILVVARMLYDKGISEFIDAAKEINNYNIQAKFILVGPLAPGNPAMIPKSQIDKWCKKEHILYLGRRRDIKNLMHLADIVVLPSYREGMPLSLLEAMAMEKPIITTDTVGCREVVRNGQNGFLVPIKDSKKLADAINVLIKDPTLRKKMGNKSRIIAECEYNEDIVIRRTLEHYKNLIEKPPS